MAVRLLISSRCRSVGAVAPKKVKPKLTGKDYIHKPVKELVNHPDFSQHAYRVMIAISEMTTAQIEQINLPNGRTN